MGFAQIRDLASFIKLNALTAQSGVAAGTGDNTELTSGAVDRCIAGGISYLSAVFSLFYLTTIASSQTLKLTLKISDSDDGSSFGSDTTLINASTIKSGAVTASYNAYELGIDLSKYKRYVRFKVTLDLSASGTDTFLYASGLILGGADALPA